jgi:hypothetical protein
MCWCVIIYVFITTAFFLLLPVVYFTAGSKGVPIGRRQDYRIVTLSKANTLYLVYQFVKKYEELRILNKSFKYYAKNGKPPNSSLHYECWYLATVFFSPQIYMILLRTHKTPSCNKLKNSNPSTLVDYNNGDINMFHSNSHT